MCTEGVGIQIKGRVPGEADDDVVSLKEANKNKGGGVGMRDEEALLAARLVLLSPCSLFVVCASEVKSPKTDARQSQTFLAFTEKILFHLRSALFLGVRGREKDCLEAVAKRHVPTANAKVVQRRGSRGRRE